MKNEADAEKEIAKNEEKLRGCQGGDEQSGNAVYS